MKVASNRHIAKATNAPQNPAGAKYLDILEKK